MVFLEIAHQLIQHVKKLPLALLLALHSYLIHLGFHKYFIRSDINSAKARCLSIGLFIPNKTL